ncbi:MAG: ABC transporter ATP-binding protein, partial [Clostridia bacterium]|nr:ABC transporter ATP-binding protein [Clostridia bacterium]
ARHGEIMEHFHEDFQTTVNRTTVLLPSFCCALVQTGVYFGYLALQDPWVALVLLGLSAIQLFPPMVVKKWMERNYNDCCEMDEVLLDYTMQAYHGFAAIRMYGLKSWWQNGLKALHKEYIRIGNRSTITGTAENTMDSFVEHILRYGSYGIMGIFVLTEFVPMETALEAIALSAGFFGAVKTAAGSIPAFAVSRKAEERLSPWFAEDENPPAAIHSAGISMEKLSCTLGDKKILTELTDTLDLSRITLLKGKNGAGKSTLMRLLIGLLVPDAGIVQIDGVSPEMFCGDTYPRKLFYLPQEDAVYHMTPMELYRMLTADAVSKAVSIAARFGLTAEQLAENDIDTMSGGERKKVFLTLAFTLDPVILLLDEPTNSLDDASRKELCTLLKERKSGALIITHDPILDSAADRIVILTQGGLHHEK